MTNIKKFFSEFEDVVYSSINKQEGDKIINGYQKIFSIVNFDNYKLSLQKNLKIAVKHKAFANKVYLWFNNGSYFINDREVELRSINDILPTFFIIELDKKEEEMQTA